jgi:hypothetical protein
MRSEKVRVGQVRPGTESAPSARRGIRANSLAQSSLPRSATSARVFSWATITSASNADAPSTRTAW